MAIRKGEEALQLLDAIEGDLFKVTGLQRLGLLHYLIGDYTKALAYYERITDLPNAPASILEFTYNGIAVLHERRKNYTKSTEYHLKSLELCEQNNRTRALPIRLNNVGASYSYQEKLSKALEYFTEGKRLSEELDYNFGLSLSLLNIGETYEKQDKNDRAMELYHQGLNAVTWEHPDSRVLIVHAKKQIGNLHKKNQEYEQALRWCQESLSDAEQLQAVESQRDACECLYEAHKALENKDQALSFHEKTKVLDDSLQAIEIAQQLQQMEFRKELKADSLQQIELALEKEQAYLAELNKNNRTRNWLLAAGGLFLLLALGLWSRLRYIRKSKSELELEKDRSENLLLNILPAEVAQELKEKGKASATNYDMASILFTDFIRFTELSEKMNPEELVHEVNTCFEAFDKIVEKYGIEKIKTIGDSYMAAGNLPVPITNAEKKTVMAALDMQDFISSRKSKLQGEGKLGFEMRIGIHTGPVVAGIVGIKKFQYDLWGDTVNTASRMENQSEAGQVNISQDTFELLKNDPDFSFEKRGKIEVKGKGAMEMYFVHPAILSIGS